jgi:pyruvate kinase
LPYAVNKTKIVATIGPASDSPEVLRKLLVAGMNVARLNFSHGDFSGHSGTIKRLRDAALAVGKPLAIMADLPGPKMRIGKLAQEPVQLMPGETITLTTEEILGTRQRVSVSFPGLPAAVQPGDLLFLNDGYIELEVVKVSAADVVCRVEVGGELRSRKGLNLPGIELGISAFTDHDRNCLEFCMRYGVDAISQSFVDRPSDITDVRSAAAKMGYQPLILAKIERSNALDRIAEIIDAADGIMVARGDLGVEIPIEEMAVTQKRLMRLANMKCKPVITATQMLESMITNRLPTRAEATDVANAILDGTDAVMLSGESAVGRYPADAVAMLVRIAIATERHRLTLAIPPGSDANGISEQCPPEELIASSVGSTIGCITPAAVIVPTRSGITARRISRFRPPVWITAVSSELKTCRDLLFSYGVFPVHEPEHPEDWKSWIRRWLEDHGRQGRYVVLTEGPSRKHPDRNNSMEIIDLKV